MSLPEFETRNAKFKMQNANAKKYNSGNYLKCKSLVSWKLLTDISNLFAESSQLILHTLEKTVHILKIIG